MSVGASIASPSQSSSEGFNRSWKLIVIKEKLRRERTASVGVTPLNSTLGRCPNGIFATCKRGGFVLQRATKPAKELIAQNPPQNCLQPRATSGLVFATCKRVGFVLQRATKPAKELIAQNPSQDCLQTPSDLGPGFCTASGNSTVGCSRQQVAARRQQ